MKKQLQSISSKQILFVLFILLYANKLFSQTTMYDNGIQIIFEAKTYKNGFNISCNGNSDGNVTATVVGGTYPFHYSWNRGDTTQNLVNAVAGIYTLTVTDADDHQGTGRIELKEPDLLDATLYPSIVEGGYNIAKIGGSNGFIKTEIKGGTPPYKYTWNNGSHREVIEGVQAGTYSVTITDQNHCAVSRTQVLTEPTLLHIVSITASNYNGKNISCAGGNDGAITLTVAGGSPPYTFNWSNGSLDQNPTNLTAGDYRVNVTDANGTVQQGVITLAEPDGLGVKLIPSNYFGFNISCANCDDGSITSTVLGGTAPYTYMWINGQTEANLRNMGVEKRGWVYNSNIGTLGPVTANVSNLRQGEYAVIVTDANGCRTINGIGLKETPMGIGMKVITTPKTYKAKTNISCNGASDGEIDVTVLGGMAPYDFLWSNGSTAQNLKGIRAGAYSLKVTDNKGQTFTSDTITLYEPDKFNVYLKKSKFFDGYYNVSKSGGSDGALRAWVKGGNPPYNFAWSNDSTTQTIEDLTAGTYNLTVTDNSGCAVSASANLVEPTPLHLVSITAANHNGYNVSCAKGEDGAITLTVAGGVPPLKYIWSNGSFRQNPTKLRADDYEVRVIDANGWEVQGQITLTEPPPLQLQLTTSNYNGNNISCFGCANGTVTTAVTGGTAPYIYAWRSDNQSINGQTTANLSNLDVGKYDVIVTDANSCTSENAVGLTQPANNGWDFGGNTVDSSKFIGSTNRSPVIIKSNNTEQMRIAETGNVGIGTSTPTEKMDVVGNANVSGSITSSALKLGTISNNIQLTPFLTSTGGTALSLGNHTPINPLIGCLPPFINDNFITTRTTIIFPNSITGLDLRNDGTNGYIDYGADSGDHIVSVLKINSSCHINTTINENGGSVGIGIATPLAKLHVNGTSIMNGKVFIGMTTCTTCSNNLYKLYVEGGIATRDVKVTAGAFPDYVFEKEYKLMTIYELEKYINKNKHLPEIPSATEIEKNDGYEIGDMQTKLVKKIEEQTLYIIDLQKQMDELKKQLNELNSK